MLLVFLSVDSAFPVFLGLPAIYSLKNNPCHVLIILSNPASIYLLQVSKGNTRTKYEIYPNLIIKSPERCQ